MNNSGLESQRPSERTARFVLGIITWIKDIFKAPVTYIPRGQVVQHQGKYLAAGKAVRYPHILLVEDNPHTVEEFIGAIKNYYACGSVKILIAYAYDAAVTFFHKENPDLVIMDADLDDEEGDGATLTRKFLGERPEIIILANSSSKISNLRLTGCGAVETLGKSTEKLKSWLMVNDPAGGES
ncbi:MAG: response regulator [Desulfobulbales bacterium]|nr:response regulator [Desulfobulbales bacterium]